MQIVTEAEKNRQMKKEALISLIVYLAFFLWWWITGYGIASRGTVETYTYIWGLPLWFFLSSIVGYVLFSVATVVVVKIFFKDFDFGDENFEGGEE